MATASAMSSTLSNKGASLDTASSKLQHMPSPRKLKRLQSASTDEQGSESKCKRCGWHYPIPSPNSRQRRQHKKICPKRSSLGSEEETQRSGGHRGPEGSESGGSILTGDHEHRDPAESRKTLAFGEMEAEKVKEREEAQNETEKGVVDKVQQSPSEVPEIGRDDKLKQGSSKVPTYSGHQDSGTGQEKVAGLKQKELGSQHVPEEEPQAGRSPSIQSDERMGSDSEVSSGAETQRSGGHRGPEGSESGGSILTGDHELRDPAESRKTLAFGEMEAEKVKEREEAQNETEKGVVDKVQQSPSEVPEIGRDDKLKQGSSKVPTYSGHQDSGTGEEKVAGLKQKELGSQHVPDEELQAGRSPSIQSDERMGSDSEVSSGAGEHETDLSDDMGFDSSHIEEVAKREDILPSDDEILEEEKKYGAIEHKHPHTLLKGDSESSHGPKPEGEGKPVNVAKLVTMYDKGKSSSASLPSDVKSDYMPLAGVKPFGPSTKVVEHGEHSLRSTDHNHRRDIISVEEIVEEGCQSTARGADYDLEVILRMQKTHDLVCPVCGAVITNRIILRKKRRTFVSKNEAAQLPNWTEITEVSDQEDSVKAIKPWGQGTWIGRCLGYFGFIRRDS